MSRIAIKSTSLANPTFGPLLGAAVLIHALLFLLLTFRLPAAPALLRPPIVFLGAFLSDLDTQAYPDRPLVDLHRSSQHHLPMSASKPWIPTPIEKSKQSLHQTLPTIPKKTAPTFNHIRVKTPQDKTDDKPEPFEHIPLKLP